MDPQELAWAQARYAVEQDVTNYVRLEAGNPWLHLTINPLTDRLEVWYNQPGRKPYLVCSRPFEPGKGLQIPQLIQHLNEISLSKETLAERVQRLEREAEAAKKNRHDEYLDKQMPVAEKIYYLLDKEIEGFKSRVF
jgi:hypothetical protein